MKRIRVVKDKNFTTINNEFIFNKEMSLKAKGLLCHLLALPNDWKLYVEEVEKWHKDGKKAIYSAFKELTQLGYMERSQVREAGLFKGYDYTVFEVPYSQKRNTDKRNTDKRNAENAPLLKTDNSKDLLKVNTDNNKTKGFETLEELNVEVWKKWREFRTQQFRTSYKPIGEKAAIGKLLRLSQGCHKVQEQIIQQSIENGWKGLFELKGEKQSKIKQSLNTWSEARKMINNG
mgnify:FL=1|tara:strand:- start:4060 stop:4758 length:699 start_codon:yes stop_codon:yes gene_type:complete